MLPTNAKMAALVCSGRSRPKERKLKPKLSWGNASCEAMKMPTSIATAPQMMVASANLRTTASS